MPTARSYLLLTLLTLVAGYADAVSFFGLGVFTANMTGNTVLLAGAAASHFLPHMAIGFSVAMTALSLGCFVAGAAAAALILRGETGRPPVRAILVMTVVTGLMIASAILFDRDPGGRSVPLCVGMLSVIAGLQAVVASRAGVPGITTVVVTGTLVTAVSNFFGSTPQDDRRRAAIPYGADWAIYLAGAVLGSAGLGGLGNHAFWPPAVVVALLLPVL